MTKDLEALIRRNELAQERFKDLEEYFGGSKSILEDREKFKKWLERGEQAIKKVDEMESKLEQQPSDCKIFEHKENCFGGATEYECNHCDYKMQTVEQQPSDDCVSRTQALSAIRNLYPSAPFIRANWEKWQEKNKKYFECEDIIKALPPVTPTFPKGAANYDVLKAVFGGISAFRIKDTMEFEKGFESWFSKPYKRGDKDGSN